MARNNRFDILILGGGLAGGLIALAFARLRPELSIGIVEASEKLGGNHIWSFFDSDIAEPDRWLVDPLIGHRWNGYDVAFPAFSRGFDAGYNSIESERLDEVVRETIGQTTGGAVVQGSVVEVHSESVTLADGREITAGAIIDARGAGDLATLDCGWQKFMGRSITVEGGHGLTRPVVMDATVDQAEGYRFVYLLPFDESRIFIEDTYYSDTPTLDVDVMARRIDDYAVSRGWRVSAIERTETGVLPVVMGGDFNRYWDSTGVAVAKAGVRGGLFHPLTSYSLPDAVGFAAHIAATREIDSASLRNAAQNYARAHWTSGRYYRLLTTMLFRAADPPQRYRVLQRFYGLRPALIGRFYAGHSTILDKIRILAGRPPVPIARAIKALTGKKS